MPMRFATEPCPDPQAFYFRSGTRARSLAEFRDTLHKVSGDDVAFHRQHFHFWVRDVLAAPDLAEKVRAEGERNADGEQLRQRLDILLRNALPSAAPNRASNAAPAGAGTATGGTAAKEGGAPAKKGLFGGERGGARGR